MAHEVCEAVDSADKVRSPDGGRQRGSNEKSNGWRISEVGIVFRNLYLIFVLKLFSTHAVLLVMHLTLKKVSSEYSNKY